MPLKIRTLYGVKSGTFVIFSRGKDIINNTLITLEEIEANIGFLRKGGSFLKALMNEKMNEKEL
jgi:hypothetical protein